MNAAAEGLYGYTRDEFLGMTLREIRPPGDAAPLQADVEVPRTGVRSSGPWRHQRKDGRTLLVEIVTHDVSFEGRAARLVLVGDVTERVRAEEKLRAFFDSGMVGAFLADGNGRITTANDELLRIVGRTRADAEAGALSWQGLTPPEWLEVDVARAAEARERGVCTPYEKEYLRKDGSRVPVLVGFALVGESREESVAFVLDLTDRKAAEEEVRLLNAELEARVERRTEELVAKTRELESFAYSVSHDLRAPLRGIDGYSRLLLEDHGGRLDE